MTIELLAPVRGTGKDGPVVTSSNADINPTRESCSISSGSKVLTVADETPFTAGDLVYIHKTRGNTTTACGTSYLARVVSTATNVLNLDRNAPAAFQDSGADQSQCILVLEPTSWKLNTGITMSPAAWDGSVGGINIVVCQGEIDIVGDIDMRGKGFGGGISVSTQHDNGYQGQGEDGVGVQGTNAANSNGGGAGTDVHDNFEGGGGGGGGHKNAGSNGKDNGGSEKGLGGDASSMTNAFTVIIFGGGGGSGAAPHNTSGASGKGGTSPGILILIFRKLTVTGRIYIDGQDGDDSSATPAGAGGGSAASSGWFLGDEAVIGTDLITAAKGIGGLGFQGTTKPDGGDGSIGYLRFDVGKLTGTISAANGDVTTTEGGHDWLGHLGV